MLNRHLQVKLVKEQDLVELPIPEAAEVYFVEPEKIVTRAIQGLCAYVALDTVRKVAVALASK
jgi:hypothetical protein